MKSGKKHRAKQRKQEKQNKLKENFNITVLKDFHSSLQSIIPFIKSDLSKIEDALSIKKKIESLLSTIKALKKQRPLMFEAVKDTHDFLFEQYLPEIEKNHLCKHFSVISGIFNQFSDFFHDFSFNKKHYSAEQQSLIFSYLKFYSDLYIFYNTYRNSVKADNSWEYSESFDSSNYALNLFLLKNSFDAINKSSLPVNLPEKFHSLSDIYTIMRDASERFLEMKDEFPEMQINRQEYFLRDLNACILNNLILTFYKYYIKSTKDSFRYTALFLQDQVINVTLDNGINLNLHPKDIRKDSETLRKIIFKLEPNNDTFRLFKTGEDLDSMIVVNGYLTNMLADKELHLKVEEIFKYQSNLEFFLKGVNPESPEGNLIKNLFSFMHTLISELKAIFSKDHQGNYEDLLKLLNSKIPLPENSYYNNLDDGHLTCEIANNAKLSNAKFFIVEKIKSELELSVKIEKILKEIELNLKGRKEVNIEILKTIKMLMQNKVLDNIENLPFLPTKNIFSMVLSVVKQLDEKESMITSKSFPEKKEDLKQKEEKTKEPCSEKTVKKEKTKKLPNTTKEVKKEKLSNKLSEKDSVIKKRNEEISSLKKQKVQLLNEKSSFQKQVKELSTTLIHLEKQKEELSSEVETTKVTLNKLQKEYTDSSKNLSKKNRELESLSSELEQKIQQLRRQSEKTHLLETKFSSLQEAFFKSLSKVTLLKENLQGKERELFSLQRQVHKQEENSSIIEDLEKKLAIKTKEYLLLQKKIEKVSKTPLISEEETRKNSLYKNSQNDLKSSNIQNILLDVEYFFNLYPNKENIPFGIRNLLFDALFGICIYYEGEKKLDNFNLYLIKKLELLEITAEKSKTFIFNDTKVKQLITLKGISLHWAKMGDNNSALAFPRLNSFFEKNKARLTIAKITSPLMTHSYLHQQQNNHQNQLQYKHHI